MKKMYLHPEFEVTELLADDILTASYEDPMPQVKDEVMVPVDGLFGGNK